MRSTFSALVATLLLFFSFSSTALVAAGHSTPVRRGRHGPKRMDAARRSLRIGHAGAAHARRGDGMVHLPLQPVRAREGRSYAAHLQHARARHAARVDGGTGLRKRAATTSNADGFSTKALNAALDNTVTAPDGKPAKNSLGLSIEAADTGYFASVLFGTPPKPFKILMDSGSADLWLPSTSCGQARCGKHQALGSDTSSTFKGSNTSFDVTYGTGEVAGVLAQDTVSIAGLKLTNHTFGVALVETVDFNAPTVPFDGLMGLAKSALSNQKVPTPIESLKAAGLVSSATVSYALGRVDDPTNIGQVTFGGIDPGVVQGKLTTIPNVNTQGFWEGAVDDVTVNGKSLNLANRTAILDTGTTLIVAPAADATAIHAAIPGAKSDGQGSFTVPCTTEAVVALVFGGVSFAIDVRDLAFLPVSQTALKGDCQSGISAGSIGGPQQMLVGDVFLKNVVFAHNVDKDEISLAKVKSG